MMRRSRHSRSSGRQEALGELFPASELEGDPLTRATDAAFPLRPFAAGIPLDGLSDAQAPPEESGADRLLRHGRDAVHRGRRADALAAYADLLVAAPDHLGARLEYAALLEAVGEEARALQHLGEAVRRHGERPDALVARGAFQARRKEYTEAEADLHRAIKLFPSDPAPQFELGFALWRKGLAADAAVHLRQAATLAPEQASTHYYLGEALNQAGDHAGALAALERAAALEPTNPKPFQLMGRVLDRQGRPEEAMQMYRRAREAQPQ